MTKLTTAALVGIALWPAGRAWAQTEDKFMSPYRQEGRPGDGRSSGDCDRGDRRREESPPAKGDEAPAPNGRPKTTEKSHMDSAAPPPAKGKPEPCKGRGKWLIDAAAALAARLASRS
ncbi:MAG: hypothetical protein HY921_06140 [Elusimicrobia bacterium]|nr:hypothetical protein [Elusimicrobiota bacterium]